MSKKNYSPYFIFWADYMYVILLAPNVQKLDSAFHWGSHYLVDKEWDKQLHYPLVRNSSIR